MKVLFHFVMVAATAVVGANANGEITEAASPRTPCAVNCDPLQVCELPRAEFASGAGRSPGNKVVPGETTSELWTDRFITILGFGLFLTWFVGILTSKRRLAMGAGACFAALVQIIYLSTDTWEGLEVPPLYPHVVFRVLSCGLVTGLAAAGVSFHLRPALPFGAGNLLRATVPALLAALFIFELLYFTSRMPAISPVSLSLSFRPWTRLVNPTLVVLIAAWLLSFFCMLGDSSGPGPGQNDTADGIPGPEAR